MSIREGDPVGFAAVLAGTVRSMSRKTPAPRGFPFYGLDCPQGCGTRLLTRLSEMGIFRHYEHVVQVGGGLGGAARWLARERGCRVVAVDGQEPMAQASRVLSLRSHLAGRVVEVAAATSCLPFSDGTFTHAWSVEPDEDPVAAGEPLREMFRIVRPGGRVGFQLWLSEGELTGRVERLREAGFVHVEAAPVGALREAPGAVTELALGRVRAELPGWEPPQPPVGRELFQLFGERPS